jgi:hypothetical protein
MKRYLLLLFSLVIIAGCATPATILVDGKPASKYTGIMNNPRTGIRVKFDFVRYFLRKEGKESLMWNESLPSFTERVVLPENTKLCHIILNVVNHYKTEYSLWEDWKITYKDSPEPYMITHQIYKGSLSTSLYQVKCPIENVVRADLSLVFKDKKGDLLFYIGEFKYLVE